MRRMKRVLSLALAAALLSAPLIPERAAAEPVPESLEPVDGVYVYDAGKGDPYTGANIILGHDAGVWPWSTAGTEGKTAFTPEKDAKYRLSFNITSTGADSIRVRWIKDESYNNHTQADAETVSNHVYSADQTAGVIPAFFNSGILSGNSYTLTTEVQLDGEQPAEGLIGNIAIRGGFGNHNFTINWIKVEKIGEGGAADALLVHWLKEESEEPEEPGDPPLLPEVIYYEDFESVNTLQQNGTATIARSQDYAAAGLSSLSVQTVSYENWSGAALRNDSLATKMLPGGKYKLTAKALSAKDAELGVRVETRNSAGEHTYGTVGSTTVRLAAEQWSDVSMEFTVPADHQSVTSIVFHNGAQLEDFTFYLDEVKLEAVSPPPPEEEPELKELLRFEFDNEEEHGSLFSVAASSEIEWIQQSGAGKDDDTALKVTHIDGRSYTSADNAVRLTLEQPLSAGGVYQISAWFYAPAAGNEGKGILTGPGVVLNRDYANGAYKLPSNPGTLPTDQWKEVNVRTPLMERPLESIDLRLVVNDALNHADVWYIDQIVISQVGELEDVPEWDLTLPSIAATYDGYFKIGNVMSPHQTTDAELTAMYKHHYNAMTAENDMKPQYLSPSKGVYNFTNADTLVNWALENNIEVHGHTLVWHSQSAPWLTTGSDNQPLTRAEARANMEEYINNVAGHFKGKVVSWDVVNEAFDGGSGIPTDWKTVLRKNSPWYRAYENGADPDKGESGADYIYDAFVYARLADPGATLYYNDYNETDAWKREAMALMAEDLNEKWRTDERNTDPDRPLVEVLGMQAHYWIQYLNPATAEATIARFVEAGVKVSVTELDIPSTGTGELTEELKQLQAQLYAQLFLIYKKYADHIERITFWGKTDSQSWRGSGKPLLFDDKWAAKPAFHAVIDPEGFLGIAPAEPITFNADNVGGNPFVSDSTAIKLSFSEAVSDLAADDIHLSPGTPSSVSNYATSSAEKGSLTKVSDTEYVLALTNITGTGTLGVQIVKDGIENVKKNVLVNAAVDKTALQPAPPRSYFPQNITELPKSPGLNDLFQFLDSDGGTNGRVETEADWLERREELKDLIQYYYYGRKYPTPKSAITVNEQTNEINVTITDNGNTVTASLGSVSVPEGTPPEGGWPVIIAFGFGQTAMANQNGYAVIHVANWHSSGFFNTSRTGNYYQLYPFNPDDFDFNTGSIMIAAWTVSRIIDAMEISAEANGGMNQWNINPYQSITTGVSINGKYALMAAAMDDRIGAAAPVDSGQSGVSSFRYIAEGKLFYYNAPQDRIYRRNQKGLNSIQYAGESFWLGLGTAAGFRIQTDIDYLPFDSHAVEALMAPRSLIAFVADNNFDWTTPPSSVMAMEAAKEVYEFLDSDNIAVRVRDNAHAIQNRDVPFILAVMDKQFRGQPLEVRDLYPDSNPPSYGIGAYGRISDMTIYPYEIDSSYIRWSRPGKYTLWTENEIVTEGIPATIKVHSDAAKVRLTILDADNKPTENMWTADVVDGTAVFDLTGEQVQVGRYEITTVGDDKDSKTVYFQGVDLATALRHGTARNDNGAAVMYGFTSKINKDLVEVYADGNKLTQSVQEGAEQAWILNYGVTTIPNGDNFIDNDAFDVITLRKLQMEAMPGSTFEISIDKSRLGGNQETVSWNASAAVQKIGPQPNWPPYPNSLTDDGTRPLRPATTTDFSADVAFNWNGSNVNLAAGDTLTITFSEPMHRGDFGIGFDFSDDFTLHWADDNESVEVIFNNVTKGKGDVLNIYIMRLSDAAGNMIAAPIHHSYTIAPDVPTNVTASAKGTAEIEINWTASKGATGYHVYRSNAVDGIYTKINSELITSTYYRNSGLTASTTYYYKVTAVNDGGESDHSAAVHATTNAASGPGPSPAPTPPPVQPSVATATVDAEGNAKATISAGYMSRAISGASGGTIKLDIQGAANARRLTVTIPAQQVQTAKNAGIERIDVTSALASVQLPVSLIDGAGSGEVELDIAIVDNHALTEEQQAAIGSNTVYDFHLMIGGQQISDFGEGQSVRVSLPYTLKPGENPAQIVIYYLSDDGSLEVIKNGIYNEETGMVEFSTNHFSKFAAAANPVSFNDTQQIAWASESIDALAARGIVSGVSAGTFAPDREVTRAEFVQMLIHTLDLVQPNAKSTFTDTKEGDWYYEAVASAQQLGIVSGLPDGTFGINNKMTRQEMAAMSYRAIRKAGISLSEETVPEAFSDEQDIADYAKEAVSALYQAGIISGVGNSKFDPKGTVARAQAAVILYQLLAKSK